MIFSNLFKKNKMIIICKLRMINSKTLIMDKIRVRIMRLHRKVENQAMKNKIFNNKVKIRKIWMEKINMMKIKKEIRKQ